MVLNTASIQSAWGVQNIARGRGTAAQMPRRCQITSKLARCRSVAKQAASCSGLSAAFTSASAARLARKSPPSLFQAAWALRIRTYEPGSYRDTHLTAMHPASGLRQVIGIGGSVGHSRRTVAELLQHLPAWQHPLAFEVSLNNVRGVRDQLSPPAQPWRRWRTAPLKGSPRIDAAIPLFLKSQPVQDAGCLDAVRRKELPSPRWHEAACLSCAARRKPASGASNRD